MNKKLEFSSLKSIKLIRLDFLSAATAINQIDFDRIMHLQASKAFNLNCTAYLANIIISALGIKQNARNTCYGNLDVLP